MNKEPSMERLVVTRKPGESVRLIRPSQLGEGADLLITVEKSGNRVRLSFKGPRRDYRLVREEVLAAEDPTVVIELPRRKSA